MRLEARYRFACIVSALVLTALVCASPQPPEQNEFAWVPSYPAAENSATRTLRDGDQLTCQRKFHVKDQGAAVRAFFEKELKAAGFDVMGKGGITGKNWDLRADNADGTRSIDISGNGQTDGANITVTARMALHSKK